MRKNYSKTGATCRVTFELAAKVGAESVALCGDFNDWDKEKHLMKKRVDGSFSTTISLKPGSEYRFRYWVNQERWENDWAPDKYLPNEYGTDDSVVAV